MECNSGSEPSVHCVPTDIIKKQFSHHNEEKVCFPRHIYLHWCCSIISTLKISGCSACMGRSYFIRWGVHMDTRNLDTTYECLVTPEWSCTMVCIKNVWWIYRRGVDLLLGFCCMWLNVLILWGNLLHASSGWLNCSSGCCRDKEEENVLVVLGSLTDWLITPTEGRKRGQVCCEPTEVRFS